VTANLSGMEAAPRVRVPAAERREQTVVIALRHFAEGGYRGTSTEAIAAEVGVSQPYLFRLFKTKRELFLACYDVSHARILETFRSAARGVAREDVLPAMGKAYVALLDDNTGLLFQMQAYAACSDPVIQAHVRERYGELVKEVTRLSGAPPEQVWQFFSHGMLLNVIASLDLPAIAEGEPWAETWCSPGDLIRMVRR
jgi:AcrR family transcriptional regulator